MTIRDLREILIHFEDKKYDNYEVVLWDYNNQQTLGWGASYALSHPEKELTFPVTVPPCDGVDVFDRLLKLRERFDKNKNER